MRGVGSRVGTDCSVGCGTGCQTWQSQHVRDRLGGRCDPRARRRGWWWNRRKMWKSGGYEHVADGGLGGRL